MSTPFRIDVLNAAGVKQGSGPLPNVREVNDTITLDEIGELTFSLPAGQPESALLQAGTMVDVYDPQGQGYLGRYHYSSRRLKSSRREDVIEIKCYDQLIELTRDTVGFQRGYNNVTVGSVLSDLVGLVPGWAVNYESEFTTTRTILSLEGESPFRGIDELRDRFGHFRLGGSRTLDFGRFGAVSGVRLVNLPGQVAEEIEANTEVALVTEVSLVEETDDIFNSIIPLGTGHGEGVQLTIKEAGTAGWYPVRNRTNANGTKMYYIQDDASVVAHGARWRVMSFPQIRPLDNSTTARARASLALKLTAETLMRRNLAPKLTLTIGDVKALRQPLKVGDKVRLVYKGVVDGYGYLSLNQDLWVMSIRRSRSATGERTVSLTVANTDDNRTSDSDVVLGIQRDIRALKIHVPTAPSLYPTSFTVDCGAAAGSGKPAVNGKFPVYIGDETQSLLYAILRFKTFPLISPVRGVAGGGAVSKTSEGGGDIDTTGEGGGAIVDVPTETESDVIQVEKTMQGSNLALIPVGLLISGGGGVTAQLVYDAGGGEADPLQVNTGQVPASSPHHHKMNVPKHDHPLKLPKHDHPFELDEHNHPMEYGFFSDNIYPGQIGIKINGTDRTAQLGGPWGAADETAEVEVSITDLLNSASGGVQRRHDIEFYCQSGRGRISGTVTCLNSIQAITAF